MSNQQGKDQIHQDPILSPSAIAENLEEIKTMVQGFKDKTMTEVKSAIEILKAVNASPQRPNLKQSVSATTEKHSFLNYVRHGVPLEHKALSEAEGSVLVPNDFANFVLENLEHISVLRRIGQVVQTRSAQYNAVIANRHLNAQWGDNKPAPQGFSDMGLAKKIIPIHTLSVTLRLSCTLIEDVPFNMEQWLYDHMVAEMAQKENEAFFWGGDNRPEGLLSVEKTEAGTEETVKLFKVPPQKEIVDTLIQMTCHLDPIFLGEARWIMSPKTLSQLRRLKNKQGDYLYHTSHLGEAKHTFLGHEVVLCSELNKKDQPETLLFGNFKEAYLIVDRMDMTLLRDPYSAKPDVDLFVRRRVGGGCKNLQAFCVAEFDQFVPE